MGKREDLCKLTHIIEFDEGHFEVETRKKDSDEINNTIIENIDEKSIILSDKAKTYIDITKYVEPHITEKSTRDTTSTTLKWVHIANAKRNFLGIYNKIKGKYLQHYLNEFAYKLNRRYFKDAMFDRLTVASVFNYG